MFYKNGYDNEVWNGSYIDIDASVKDLIALLVYREYVPGKCILGTRWDSRYSILDDPLRCPYDIVVKGCIELFSTLPRCIEWFKGSLYLKPSFGQEEFPTHVVNSPEWNDFIPEGRDTTIETVHDLIFNDGAVPDVKEKIKAMLRCPDRTFNTSKPVTILWTPHDRTFTVLEGNATVLAFYHQLKAKECTKGQTVRFLPAIIGIMPKDSTYPFLQFHNWKRAPRNIIGIKNYKTPEEVAQFPLPQHVEGPLNEMLNRIY